MKVAAAGEIWAAHQRSASSAATHRPANSSATSATSAAVSRPPRRATELRAHALPGEPGYDLAAVGVQCLRLGGLEAHHQDRLSVGGAEQTPPLGEGDSDAIDRIHGITRRKVGRRALHNRELLLFRRVYPDLRGGEGLGKV